MTPCATAASICLHAATTVTSRYVMWLSFLSLCAPKVTEIGRISVVMYVLDQFIYGNCS